ncbi:MAG: UvrD-helicase domain-containing protein [Deltaproteobacteria bacterium]|nr:UvrD-helicase domain-containing protein [Deltaproteobacteria bacterium]
MIDLSHLNPEQRAAVEKTEGPLLVLAGAGSGKTRVVVHRIAHLLDKRVKPEAILAVTFTNKAAGEMRERVADLVGKKKAERLTVSTFHAFGLSLLREHIDALGWPARFSIYDTQDQLALLRRLMSTLRAGQDFDLKRLLSHISLAKNAGVSPELFERVANTEDAYELVLCDLYPRYQRALKAQGAVDFDDLILLPLELLERHPSVREQVHARYQYFMVDEYQDTSHVQVRLLQALAHTGNVCAVGDDDQSIYAWRGAKPENILEFERTFPGAVEVKLTRNYRSTRAILEAANAVIALNTDRRGKELWTETPTTEPIRVVVLDDELEEAEFVAERIDEFVYEQRRSRDDIAVLYRTNGQGSTLEEALRAHKHPYRMVGGTRFFDRKEVRDALAYLRVAARPEDEVSLRRIINTPPRGIGDTTLERLGQESRSSGQPLWSVLKRAASVAGCEKAAPAVAEFVELIELHRKAMRGKGLKGGVHDFFEAAGAYEAAGAGLKSLDARDAKVANVASLVQSIERYCEGSKRPDLMEYLRRVALDGRDEDEAEDGGQGQLTLLTLHAAKGLEFPVVFLVGMEEGLLPHEGMGGLPPNLPEERRLAYVGITRARETLYLCRAKTRARRGRRQERVPSRFLEDLPAGAFEIQDRTEPAEATETEYGEGLAFFAAMQQKLAAGSQDE